MIKNEKLNFIGKEIGIVAPIYGHEVPPTVKEFMKKAAFHTDYFYMVLTYGNRHGGAEELTERFCRECGIQPDYINVLLMVDNWLRLWRQTTGISRNVSESNGIEKDGKNTIKSKIYKREEILMDLSETTKAVINRHPWELSRTKCVLDEMSGFLGNPGKKAVYINAGAGDLYFGKALLKKYKNHHLHAIDIAYEDWESDDERINKYHYFEEIHLEQADYAVMMDSLEYREDDVAYINKMCGKLRKGGYFFFTLPAFPILFSDYDINIKNLRRYNRKTFADVLSKVPELEKVEEYYFYTSLFLVRFLRKMLHVLIDPEHKFTADLESFFLVFL